MPVQEKQERRYTKNKEESGRIYLQHECFNRFGAVWYLLRFEPVASPTFGALAQGASRAMMSVSDDVLRVWLADAKRYLHRYWDHPAYDDIVAEAYLTMWEAIRAAAENQVHDLHGYAMRAAWNGAQAFLSSPRNEHRTYSVFKRKEMRSTIYLQDLVDGRYEEWSPRRLVEPDFAPSLVERLAAEAELARRPPAERAALWLCAYEGLTREEARSQLGWSRTKIDKALRRVSRAAIPYAHPGPAAPTNWHERERDERGCFR